MKLKSCGGAITCWYFLKNYSIISTDALQVGLFSSLTIVNKIVDKNFFLKTIVFIKFVVLWTIINDDPSLTIVNNNPSLTIVNDNPSLTLVNDNLR